MTTPADLTRENEAEGPSYKAEAVVRAFKALSCFSAERPSWSLAALAEATSAPKDTLRGIVNTLEARGMLRRDDAGTYRLGYAWLRLGALCRNQYDVRTLALPIMQSVRDAINETVVLSMRIADRAAYLDYVESTHAIRRRAQVGVSAPLHAGATGISLLTTFAPEELKDYLERIRASLPAANLKKFELRFAAAQRDGVAIATGTLHPDIAAVAAGLKLYSGGSIALTISCPLERFTPELKRACIAQIKDAVGQLSAKLGAKP